MNGLWWIAAAIVALMGIGGATHSGHTSGDEAIWAQHADGQ